MKVTSLRMGFGLCVALALAWPAAAEQQADVWAGYLDYAYVYSSAEAAPLRKRLAEYGKEAGRPLREYVVRSFDSVPLDGELADEVTTRRRAIAHLLEYLSRGDPASLEKSVEAVHALEGHLERHENRYWYRYVLAHRALEMGRRHDFVAEVLALWSEVVVPLEGTYETLQTLSLDGSSNAGFAAALPYLYENVARLILIRSPQMGVDRDLDPLGGIVRLLVDGRVGAHPDVIPLASSSREHLQRIVARLDGNESDGGSLTFTLALFEASRYHEQARGLLAKEGLSERTLEAIRVSTGAYRAAYERASLMQGRVAVFGRVLRQLGEIYAAKQRLGVDPEIESPFRLEEAYELYDMLALAKNEEDLAALGYAKGGSKAHLESMRVFWEEIQEATLNAADYYLFRSVEQPHRGYENSRAAARLYTRYLEFFLDHTSRGVREAIPESAYFAAHEAARGIGDSYFLYDSHPTKGEVELGLRRYRQALRMFPFDRTLWSALASALQHRGREGDYLELVKPAAAELTRSRSVDTWIQNAEPEAKRVAAMRRASSDSLVLVYLGFADTEVKDLEQELAGLGSERDALKRKLAGLLARREGKPGAAVPASLDADGSGSGSGSPNAAELVMLNREIEETRALLDRLERQIEARGRTLPLYRQTLVTDGLADDLRARRNHPLHTLLRRMFHEGRS
ncbi:MAG: hypothetical protein QNK03_16165 [Myxococcota bacterium]|nr:hypothetical protein [Myxococcota bacterium]